MNPVRKSQCALVLVVALMAACGGEQTTTEPPGATGPVPSAIALVSGDNQSGTVGQSLGQPLVVRVTSSSGAGVSGIAVTWSVTSGGGSVSNSTSTTDGQGRASIAWTLGQSAGSDNNKVQVSASGLSGSPVTFTASAGTGPPASISIVSGDDQTGTVGEQVAAALVVRVTDQFGNPNDAVAVTWSVSAGGGSVSTASTTTDAQGLSSVMWTLGTVSGTDNNTLAATAAGVTGSSADFSATGDPGPPAKLSVVSGGGQTGIAGQPLAQPFVVLVQDQFDNAVAAVTVNWAVTAGGGAVTASTTLTDAQGQTGVTVTLGTSAGTDNNLVEASATGLTGSPITFTASANAATASKLSVVSGIAQSGTVAQTLGNALVVVAQDPFDNPAEGVTVTWTVTSGGGTLSSTSTATDAQGQASVTWTIGSMAGANNNGVDATASGLSGSPVSFAASATADAPTTISLVSGNAQTGTVGQSLSQPLVVLTEDQFGNPTSGVSVQWTATAGGGSVSASSTPTDAQGQASVTWTLGTVAGTDNNVFEAAVPGLAGSPIQFTASALAGSAAQLSLDGGDNQTAPAGTTLPVDYSVRVADTFGNAVVGVTVNWAVGSGGGFLSTGASASNAAGIASAKRTLGPSAGTHTATASVSGLAGSPVTLTATATPSAVISGTISVASGFFTPPAKRDVRADNLRVRVPEIRGIGQLGLRTTTQQPPGRASRLSLRQMPDELIVTYRPDAIGAPPIGSAALRAATTAEVVSARMRGHLSAVLDPADGTVVGASPAILAARIRVSDPSRIDLLAAKLRTNWSFQAVERNSISYLAITPRHGSSPLPPALPNDPLYPAQAWHYNMIDLPKAWDITTGSASVLVAVVDDGIRFDHPGIAANLTSDGYDFVTDRLVQLCGGGTISYSGDGDGYDADPTQPADYLMDVSGCALTLKSSGNHGLHVAGTIGAVGNDGVGVSGVSWNVRIRPVRVFGVAGGNSNYDIAQGILYAAGLPADNGAGGMVQAPTPAQIINMSLGGPANEVVLQNAITMASSTGALLIAAAGNEMTSDPRYPAAYPETISVSAVGPDAVLASYSNLGTTIDIAAPGGDIGDGDETFGVWSTFWDYTASVGIYGANQGTSMAAPHVSGVAALLLAQEPTLTAAQLRSRLLDYTVDLGAPGRDDFYGVGLLNARNSLTQSLAPPGNLHARLYDAGTGAAIQTILAQFDGSYTFPELPDGDYYVFAGFDENGDQVLGSPGRVWGAFGGSATPTTVTVAGAGSYPATFTIGLPLELEPNETVGDNILPVGGYVFGTVGSENSDVFQVNIAQTGTYTFETSGWVGACGFALESNTILNLYDSAVNLIATNDDIDAGALNFCSRITMSLSPGIYYIQVGGTVLGLGYRVEARSGS